MKAAKLKPIILSRNAGWNMSLTFYTDAAGTVPFDLTGYSIKSQIRAQANSESDLMADISVDIAADPTTGRADFSLLQADIAAIVPDSGYMDVLIAPTGGEPRRIAYTTVSISDGATSWPL